MNKAQAKAAIDAASEDYKNMVDLLALYSDANNRLVEIETDANHDLLETIDEKKPEYSKLQATLTTTESALELIARRHPEWFQVKKTIKTPYGEVKLQHSTSLEIKDEEITQVLIEKEIAVLTVKIENEKNAEVLAAHNTRLATLKSLLRPKTELNKEALEKLDDVDLKNFRVVRQEKENFSVKPAKIDMGKAVKEAVARENETQKAA